MKVVQRFEIVERLRGRLRLSGPGHEDEVEVDGVVLEAQLELPSGEFVLWSTEDCPFEETLHITLISPTGEVLETADLGHALQPGLFGNLEALGAATAEFDFFPEQRHRLEVLHLHRGLLSGVLRRRRLKLAVTDQAPNHDEPT